VSLAPVAFVRDDVHAVRRSAPCYEAFVDALHVCALFNMIVRIADGLGFEIPPASYFAEDAPSFLERGYLPQG
jgi:hypothetical protein